jgi:L-malate glycosyltransferase
MSTPRLKILFLAAWYPSKDNPLLGTFVQEHAKAVHIYDDITVLHHIGCEQALPKRWMVNKEDNIEYSLSIPTFHLKWRLSRIPNLTYLYFLLANLAAFRQFIRSGFHPDVIHAHIYTAGVPGILLGWLYRIPIVITEHSTAFPRHLLPQTEIIKARFAFQNAQKVVVVSRALQAAIESFGIQGNFQIIANAVDQDLFFLSKSQHPAGSPIRLLYVNRITNVKGLGDLITALSTMNKLRYDWHLDVVGDGPQKSEFEQLSSSLNLESRISYHGYIPKHKIPEFMRQADIFILPSHIETFSVVTAEALSCGLPALATRCGGPEEFITPEVGRIVPIAAPEELAEELSWMMENLPRFSREKISEYAKNNFSLEVIGSQYHSIYHTLLDNKNL